MSKLRFFANSLAALAVSIQLTACLSNEDPHSAGFQFTKPVQVRTSVYANTSGDSLIMLCLGPWKISADTPDSHWCTIDETKGYGNAIYRLGVHFEQNVTGQPRLTQFTITDTAYPDEAHSTWQYLQYATRGDGSLGSAALVKTITSSDNWTVNISYDTKCRPVQLTVNGPEGTNEQYRMTYDEKAMRMTVTNNNVTMTGTMNNGYQPEQLIASSDTVGYAPQYYSNGIQISFSNAFNYIAARARRTQAYAYLLNGKSLAPDSLHTADSLVYYSLWKTVNKPNTIERFGLEYSTMDNRCQTVDVNQLLLGMDDCEPLQLISLFRYTRSTAIVRRATTANGTIDVATELNANRSVRRMTVTDSRRNTQVTYDFAY